MSGSGVIRPRVHHLHSYSNAGCCCGRKVVALVNAFCRTHPLSSPFPFFSWSSAYFLFVVALVLHFIFAAMYIPKAIVGGLALRSISSGGKHHRRACNTTPEIPAPDPAPAPEPAPAPAPVDGGIDYSIPSTWEVSLTESRTSWASLLFRCFTGPRDNRQL